MPTRQKPKKSPQRLATEFFVSSVIALAVGIITVSISDVSCSTTDGVQICTQYTYDGLDGHTFGIVLIVGALLCAVCGAYYLSKSRKMLEGPQRIAGTPTQQPLRPQQPGGYPAYPSSPNGDFPDPAPIQPPSKPQPPA